MEELLRLTAPVQGLAFPSPVTYPTHPSYNRFPVGLRTVFRETDPAGGRLRDVVTVTARTKRLADGITARVVRDVVTQRGRVVERTEDYYAQDRCGNVWYFGEDTATLDEHGRVEDTSCSFLAGVDGAQPGVYMQARP